MRFVAATVLLALLVSDYCTAASLGGPNPSNGKKVHISYQSQSTLECLNEICISSSTQQHNDEPPTVENNVHYGQYPGSWPRRSPLGSS